MAKEHPDSLQVLFRKLVPVRFIDYLLRRQEWIYQEAFQVSHDSALWSEAEARNLVGDMERAIFENEMRKSADVCGLKWENAEHAGDNFNFVRVIAGQFRLTGHRVSCPGYFVRPCVSRRQDAVVNRFMDGYVLDGALTVPLPKLEAAKAINVYILHGSTTVDGQRRLFLELAAPDSELEGYHWQCSFLDLRQAYLADARQQKRTGALEDKAKPKPRKQRTEEAQNG